VSASSLLQNFQINALGPILVSKVRRYQLICRGSRAAAALEQPHCAEVHVCAHHQEFAPLLSKAASASGASKERPAVVANLSARVGSISDNSLGGWYSYR
jgi:hypothetical protein